MSIRLVTDNGNAESLKWMEDTGFLLEEGYRFGDNDYERQHMYRQEASDKSRKNRIRQCRKGKRL